MDIIIVTTAALCASALTLFSGFGLGTLLLPVFAIFFPLDLAVAATALVHGANSLLKAAMLGKDADRSVLLRFALPAILAAFAGAYLLGELASLPTLFTYRLGGAHFTITPLKILMALLMAAFATAELHPRFDDLSFPTSLLPIGGLLSGFFGGLSGHQGALRSAFLAKVGLNAKAFVGTNAIIGLLVDITRLSVYASLLAGGKLTNMSTRNDQVLILAAIAAAFLGVVLGKRLLKKITMRMIQRLTGIMLIAIAILLAAGII